MGACRVLETYARVFATAAPSRWLWSGLYRWLTGRRRAAVEHWRRAAAAAARLGMPYEEATAHAELGRHLSGALHREHLEQAATIFERLGATFDAAEAQTALAS
jgi:hypothetical protein